MSIIEKAKNYAIQCHEDTNHRYNHHPYSFHLNMVYEYGLKYKELIPSFMHETCLAACWTHDLIEDCRQTYNDVKRATNKDIANITFALTNEKGKNRKERGNEKYYQEMKMVPGAVFVKLCDRLANVKYSKEANHKMLKTYRREHPDFLNKIYIGGFDSMFNELDELLK